jgi:hypothetical protein
MKNYLVAALMIILFSACRVQRTSQEIDYIPPNQYLMGIDFRPYADKGFHFTPYVYQFKHTIIAEVDYVITPEARLIESKGMDGTPVKSWEQGNIDIETAIDSLYNRCVDMGADAFMNFKIEEYTVSHTDIKPPASILGKRITGTAIKRED